MTVYRTVNFDRLDDTIRQAVLYWVQLYEDEYEFFDDGSLEERPQFSGGFLRLVEEIYYSELPNIHRSYDREEEPFDQGPYPETNLRISASELMISPPPEGTPTTYIHYGESREILYVGKTTRPAKRQSEHRGACSWWELIRSIEFTVYPDGAMMSFEELRLIKEFRPTHNVSYNKGVLS